MEIAEPLRIVIEELSKLPSIGRKSAQRLALHLVKKEKQDLEELINALIELKDNIKFCSQSLTFQLVIFVVCAQIPNEIGL